MIQFTLPRREVCFEKIERKSLINLFQFNFEVDLISINASNRTEIFEKFNITREMIPAVFIDHKLVCHGKISESVVKEAIEDWYRNIKI